MEPQQRILHLIFWALYLLVQSLVYMNFYEFETIKIVRETGEEMVERTSFPNTFLISLWVQALELPGKLIVVYLHLVVLLKTYLFHKRFGWYFVGIMLALLLANFTQGFLLQYLPIPGFMYNSAFSSDRVLTQSLQYSFSCLAVMGVTGALEVLRHYYQELGRRQEIEQQHLSTELQLLRAQIHPHFFFNTLNSLYGLALERSEQTPESILRLSDLMHYVLYEAKAKDVPLRRELDIIRDYIALETIRYGDRVLVAQHQEGDLDGWRVPALLLLPLVENAFKHGVSPETAQAWINISVQSTSQQLRWVIENSLAPVPPSTRSAGLGLANVRRRLELLFPHQHRLDIFVEQDAFLVILEINV